MLTTSAGLSQHASLAAPPAETPFAIARSAGAQPRWSQSIEERAATPMRVIDEQQHPKQRRGFFTFVAIFLGNIGFGHTKSLDIAGWLRTKTRSGTSQSAIKLVRLSRNEINLTSSSRLRTGTGFGDIATGISVWQASGQSWQSVPGSKTMASTLNVVFHQVLNILLMNNESVPIGVAPDAPNLVVDVRIPYVF